MNVAPEKERKKKELADFRQIDIVKGTSHYALCEEQCLTPFGLLQKKKKKKPCTRWFNQSTLFLPALAVGKLKIKMPMKMEFLPDFIDDHLIISVWPQVVERRWRGFWGLFYKVTNPICKVFAIMTKSLPKKPIPSSDHIRD